MSRYTTRSSGSHSPDDINQFDYSNLPSTSRTATKKTSTTSHSASTSNMSKKHGKRPIQPSPMPAEALGDAVADRGKTQDRKKRELTAATPVSFGIDGRSFAHDMRHLPRQSDLARPRFVDHDTADRKSASPMPRERRYVSASTIESVQYITGNQRRLGNDPGSTLAATRKRNLVNVDYDTSLLRDRLIHLILLFSFVIVASYSLTVALLWIFVIFCSAWDSCNNDEAALRRFYQSIQIDDTWKQYVRSARQELSPSTRKTVKAAVLFIAKIFKYYFLFIVAISLSSHMGQMYHHEADDVGLLTRVVQNFANIDFILGLNGARKAKVWWVSRVCSGFIVWVSQLMKASLCGIRTLSMQIWDRVAHIVARTGEILAFQGPKQETSWAGYTPKYKHDYTGTPFSNTERWWPDEED